MTKVGAHPPMLKESEDQITIIEYGLCFENCARDTCTRVKKLQPTPSGGSKFSGGRELQNSTTRLSVSHLAWKLLVPIGREILESPDKDKYIWNCITWHNNTFTSMNHYPLSVGLGYQRMGCEWVLSLDDLFKWETITEEAWGSESARGLGMCGGHQI